MENIVRKQSYLCVGLDPDISKMPSCLGKDVDAVKTFNRRIIDATAPYCVAFKPNLAFYETFGAEGWTVFEDTVRYIRQNYPDQFIIADAKRGDIGNTSKKYADSFFKETDVDAVTISPYMGCDSVEPFLDYEGKWVVLLCLTSNGGSRDFQMLECEDGQCVFEKVLERSKEWAGSDKLMYVAGATRGELLAKVREHVPDSFLLIPGVGKQGGKLSDIADYAMTRDCGVIVNASRSILYASDGADYAEAAADEAKKMALEMAETLRAKGIIG